MERITPFREFRLKSNELAFRRTCDDVDTSGAVVGLMAGMTAGKKRVVLFYQAGESSDESFFVEPARGTVAVSRAGRVLVYHGGSPPLLKAFSKKGKKKFREDSIFLNSSRQPLNMRPCRSSSEIQGAIVRILSDFCRLHFAQSNRTLVAVRLLPPFENGMS